MTTDLYDVKDLHVDGDTLVAALFIPEDVCFFDGHFDGFPVLPGVAQLHWAINLAVENFRIKGAFSSIDMLKFMRVIRPNQTVTLTVSYNADKQVIDFSYSADDILHSKGKVAFGV